MSKRKNLTSASPDLDPATIAHLKVLERQRRNAHRTLLKRRRRKSHQ